MLRSPYEVIPIGSRTSVYVDLGLSFPAWACVAKNMTVRRPWFIPFVVFRSPNGGFMAVTNTNPRHHENPVDALDAMASADALEELNFDSRFNETAESLSDF